MSLHADARRVLGDWDHPDADQRALRDAYLAHLDDHPDAADRSCHPDHLTASVAVLSADRSQVVLTLHARLGRWLQTGGHCEPDDATLAGAALREGREETGIEALSIDPVPVLLSRHEVPCGPISPAHHLDVQFVATAEPGATPVRSEESSDLRWFDVDALPEGSDASVRDLVRAAVGRTAQSASPDPVGSPRPPAADQPSR
ncbi:NUDIX hydrolase [Solicola sp. PLA-1-18]|uniref:NUDIX hydrolase n=1 Tax=Solicola sp. PLA-1-18 TaxID=3380532 RepID=UPI003B7E8CF9